MSSNENSDIGEEPDRITEADTLSDDGRRYRTMTVNKSGIPVSDEDS